MRELMVDFTGVKTLWGLHKVLQESLEFPDYYGKNLDALWDCLKDYCDESHVTIMGLDTLPKGEAFQEEVEGILKVFEDGVKEMKSFSFTIADSTKERG